MTMKTVVCMSHYLNCGVGHCLKWSYFYQALAAVQGQWRTGSLGSSLTFSSVCICTQVQVVCPQGSCKVFRTTNCSVSEKSALKIGYSSIQTSKPGL